MKKVLKLVAVMLVAVFIAIQFFRPSFSNPAIVPGQPIEESMNVSADVQMVLSRSCNDCHSNKSVYPWYSHIAPASWFLADHIDAGRRDLNFSEWGSYTPDRKAHKLEEICEMIESGSMPLPSYLWIHRGAALEPSQRKLLCDWAASERNNLGIE